MKKMIFLVIIPLVFMTGCWDQSMLKNLNLVSVAGFDLTNKNKLKTTVVIPIVKKGSPGGQNGAVGLSPPMDQIISSTAPTPRRARMNINNEIFSSFNASKLLNMGFGEKLAKTHIFPYLDIFFRDPKGSLNANLFVTAGESSDLLNYSNKLNPRIGDYIDELLKSAVEATIVSKTSIQSICGELMDPGADFVIPYLELKKKQNAIKLKGAALFHGDTFTGDYLTPEESTMFLLIKGENKKVARLTIKTSNKKGDQVENYVNINILQTSPKMRLKISPSGEITAKYDVKLHIAVEEYPHDKLSSAKQRKMLTDKLTKILTARANKLTEKLQKNNCDAYGIGRQLNAFHHDVWAKSNWEKDYRKVKFKMNVKTILVQQGVIN